MTTEDLAAMDAAIRKESPIKADYVSAYERRIYRTGMVAGRKEAEAERDALRKACAAVSSHYSASLDYQPPYVAMCRAAMLAGKEKP